MNTTELIEWARKFYKSQVDSRARMKVDETFEDFCLQIQEEHNLSLEAAQTYTSAYFFGIAEVNSRINSTVISYVAKIPSGDLDIDKVFETAGRKLKLSEEASRHFSRGYIAAMRHAIDKQPSLNPLV